MTSFNAKTRAKRVAFALLATVAFGAGAASAQGYGRHYVYGEPEYFSPAWRHCVPANGAEIIGGSARSNEWIDTATGESCGFR